MTRRLICLSLLASFAAAAGTTPGKNDQDPGTGAALCSALLDARELIEDPAPGNLDQATAALAGLKAAVVLVRWSGGDPRQGPRATYVVPPTDGGDAGRFAVLAGSRRVVLGDLERIDRASGPGGVDFRVLAGLPLDFRPPGQMIRVSPRTLPLTEVILDHQAAPQLVLYDQDGGDVFYVVATGTLDAFRDADFVGTAIGRATNLTEWFEHPLRSAQDDQLIRLPHYAVLSHAAFQKLKELAREVPVALAKPSTRRLATAVNDCLEQTCAVTAPKVVSLQAKAPTSDEDASAFVPIKFSDYPLRPLPPPEELLTRARNIALNPGQIAKFLVDVSVETTADHRYVLAYDHALDLILDRIWAHYFEGRTRRHRLLRGDGPKVLNSAGMDTLAKDRLSLAWRELLGNLAKP